MVCRGSKLNIQAGTQFCDKSFQEEMARGSLSSVSLDKYTCVALSGVAAEYLTFGRAEGGLGDVHQLDALLQAIGVNLSPVLSPITCGFQHHCQTCLYRISIPARFVCTGIIVSCMAIYWKVCGKCSLPSKALAWLLVEEWVCNTLGVHC